MANRRTIAKGPKEERLTASGWLHRRAADQTWLMTAAAGNRVTPGVYVAEMEAR